MSTTTKSGFNRIARLYRWAEYATFGRSLMQSRVHFLPALSQSMSALVLGDGDGRFTAELAHANPTLRIDAVDESPEMLRLLTRRTPKNNLHTHCIDALRFTPQTTYDLIVTHFFLDCLTTQQVYGLTHCIVPACAPGTLWIVSEFDVPRGLLHWPARALIAALYLAFRILTGLTITRLPAWRDALHQAGFTPEATHPTLGGLLVSERWIFQPSSSNRDKINLQ